MITINNMEVVKLATIPPESSYVGLSNGDGIYFLLTDEPINAAVYKLAEADSITLNIGMELSTIVSIVNEETYEIDGVVIMYSVLNDDESEIEETVKLIG